MKLFIRLALYLCLALSLAQPAFADCRLVKITQMPLEELGNHYDVMVKINDVMRPMIVDTGAEVTAINVSAADDLKLKPDFASISSLRPVAGIGQTTGELHLNVIPSSLAFGDLIYRDRSTVVANMDFGKLPESASIGLLGDDILSQFDVEFDFPSKQLTFYSALNCYDTFLPWTGIYSIVPFDHHEGKITVDVVLNDERTLAIVDTGNNVSFVTRRAAALWNVGDSELINTKGSSTSPLNGGTSLPMSKYMFNKVKIGNEIFPKKIINVVDVKFPLGAANLGLDFWKLRKIWISYRNNVMFVSDPSSGQPHLAYPVIEKSASVAASD